MNILLLNQFFVPDPAPTGRLLADVAVALAAQGHSVRVICGGQPADTPELLGVTVQRIRAARFGRGHLPRLMSYASFYTGALQKTLFGPKPDIVVTLTTPPLLSLLGTVGKYLRGAAHFIWEMDLYPDVAVALGVLTEDGLLERMIGALADFSRRRSDGIVILGPCMRERLAARHIPRDKTYIVENWVDRTRIAPRPTRPDGPFVVLYSGNLGLAHDVDTIAAAMEQLSDPARYRFIFAGGGGQRPALEARCRGLRHVSFLPYQDERRLGEHLGDCHAGLVTQKPKTCGAVVPSKTYSFMCAGRPFIFVGPRQATPARIIERAGCGWQIDPGDVHSLVKLLEKLASNTGMVRLAGERSRHAFLQSYDLPAGVSRFLGILNTARATTARLGTESIISDI